MNKRKIEKKYFFHIENYVCCWNYYFYYRKDIIIRMRIFQQIYIYISYIYIHTYMFYIYVKQISKVKEVFNNVFLIYY